jgi:hypothetical protein
MLSRRHFDSRCENQCETQLLRPRQWSPRTSVPEERRTLSMRVPIARVTPLLAFVLTIGVAVLPNPAEAKDNSLPRHLKDRGTGVPTSMFGTYIRKGQLLVYPFFEYSSDKNWEYIPARFGFGLNQDFRGKYRASKGQIFIGYGFTNWLALEFEAAFISATFEKSPSDPSATPTKIEESGFGDIEGQLRLRWMRESVHRPEIFSYVEITAPSQRDKLLIGDQNWDFKPGIGLVKGFSWGTVTLRTTIEYTREDSSLNLGETAVEYFKRLSPSWRVYLGVEGGEGGAPDEWDLISGAQWRITNFVFLKLDNALGITSKATDWAPEIGMVFSFNGSENRQ